MVKIAIHGKSDHSAGWRRNQLDRALGRGSNVAPLEPELSMLPSLHLRGVKVFIVTHPSEVNQIECAALRSKSILYPAHQQWGF